MMLPTVVLIPGNMCDARLWTGGDGVLMRRIDAAGFRAAPCGVMKAPTIAAIAEAILAEFSGPIVPVGFSMGGIVALAMTGMAPERIAGIALLDTNAGPDAPARAPVRLRQQRDVAEGALERVVMDELKPNYLADENRRNRPLLDLLRAMALDLGPDIFMAQSEALRTRADHRAVLATLAAPCFIACGAEDRLCPPELHAEMAHAANAELHIVPGAGHMLPLEQPGVLADLLDAFLNRIKGAA